MNLCEYTATKVMKPREPRNDEIMHNGVLKLLLFSCKYA